MAAVGVSLQAEATFAGAGVGEICDVVVPVAHGFHWSESLGDLTNSSSGVSVPGVSEVAWDDTYIFAKTRDGSWYLIDTRARGAAAIETFMPSSIWWSRRLDELGLAAPRWQHASQLPRPWWAAVSCSLIILWIVGVALWPYSALALVPPAVAVFAFRRARRRSRATPR